MTDLTFYTPCIGDEDFVFPDISTITNNDEESVSTSRPIRTTESATAADLTGLNRQQSKSINNNPDDENKTHPQSNMSSDENDCVILDTDEYKGSAKRDVNGPARPLSAYALFFKDSVNAIKAQNPTVSFAEISKIVGSMWEVLDDEHKKVYKRKAILAKVEYQQDMSQFKPTTVPDKESVQQNQTTTSAPIIRRATSPTTTECTIPIAFVSPRMQTTQPDSFQHSDVGLAPNPILNVPTQICLREGCTNMAIVNPAWEDEYCCNECVVVHCQNVFNGWVKGNLGNR